MPTPQEILFSKLDQTRLHECDNCPNWRRKTSTTRQTCEKIIADECSKLGLRTVTLVSLCSGRLMQEVFIAKALIDRGINVQFILIDHIYFEPYTGIDFLTNEPYRFDWNPSSARIYAEFVDDLLGDFNKALSELGGKASVLGVFSTVDYYLAAYNGTPPPMYEFLPAAECVTSYHRSKVLLDLYPAPSRRLQYWNETAVRENKRYGAKCHKVKPDLIVRVHGQGDDTINEILSGFGEDAPLCLDFIPDELKVTLIKHNGDKKESSYVLRC